MSGQAWDRGPSWRALTVVVVLAVAAVVFVPGGWQSLRGGRAQAQETVNPPPEGPGSCGPPVVTETVLAAMIDALASGDVIAGPGQVCVTRMVSSHDPEFDRHEFPGRKFATRQTLWQLDNGEHYPSRPLKHVTLTVQKLGTCQLRFIVRDAHRGDGTNPNHLNFFFSPDGFTNQSQSISQVRAFRIDYSARLVGDGGFGDGGGGEPCLFLWVLRETLPDA